MRLFRPWEGHRDDAALLRAVAVGDEGALAELFERHAGWLYARIMRRCSDPEMARDVLQDTFVSVWQSANTYHGVAAGGWFWVIAVRRLVDAERARTRSERASHERPGVIPSAEEHVLAGIEFGDVGAALDRISPELRAVLRATVVDGLTTREAAVMLGIPEGTVKTRAMRARRELRLLLSETASFEELEGTA